MHLERELKFRIESIAAARRLERALPLAARLRRQNLQSVYYDTPDRRLLRAGAALRMRRVGRRWLQGLKTSQSALGVLAARAEWEVPAPRGRLDASLFPREEVRASAGIDVLRLAPKLKPVFSTRFERRVGPLALGHGVRAEACIDRGMIEAAGAREPILELELELVSGELAPLIGLAESLAASAGLQPERASKAERGYRLAREAGPAAPARWMRPSLAGNAAASDALVLLCGAALEQVAANAAGVARGEDPEYLHQLRVGLRRLLSVVRVFRPLLKRKRSRAVEEALRAMMRVFGEARDWDVFDETLTHARAPKELVTRARRRRAAARRSASEAVGSPQFRVAQLHALRWLHEAPWRSDAARAEPLLRFARGSLERAHARLLKRARRIDWRNERKRHAVRIAVKRLRYACDFFSACFPHQAVQPYLRRLAAVQDTLGELNDAAVARRLLHELEAGAGTRQWVARRERALIASLGLEWSALGKRRLYWRPKQARRRRR